MKVLCASDVIASILLLPIDELQQLTSQGILPATNGQYCFAETVQRYVQLLSRQSSVVIVDLVELKGLTEELIIQQLRKIVSDDLMVELPSELDLLEQLNVQ